MPGLPGITSTSLRLMAILDRHDVCLMNADATGLITAFNPAAERLLGYSRIEVAGILTPLFFLDTGELADRNISLTSASAVDNLRHLLEACRTIGEWTLVDKQNRRIPVMLSVMADSDREEVNPGFLLAATRRLEPAQNPSPATENFICAVADALPIQFCVLDAAGNILAGNNPWPELQGLGGGRSPVAVIGKNYLSLLEAGAAKYCDSEEFSLGLRSVLDGAQSSFSVEYAYPSPAGQRWFEGQVMPFPEHAMAKAIVIHEDITPHKKQERRFRKAIESAPTAIVMVDESGSIVMVNSHAEKAFAYSRAELLGQPVEILVPERFRAGHVAYRKAYLAAPVSRPMGAGRELFALRKDGSEFPVELGLGLIDDEDGIIVLSFIIDITERRNAHERLKQALNEKELLLKEVYHRVKNNLQVVSSLINLQAGNVKNEIAGDLLRQSADRIKAMALLHEKLYQAKDLAKIDFSDFIRNLADHLLFGYGMHSGKVALNVQVDSLHLNVDTAIPLGLIINELLSNALKHAFPGDRVGTIDISLAPNSGEMVLVIADDGIGLPEEIDIKHSSSLGLQLVDTLTNQLMGCMSIERSHGTSFTLRFA